MKRRKKDEKHTCIIQERDRDLLIFLWKWKVASASLLIQRFFPGTKPSTAYRRLWVLEKANMLQSLCSPLGGRYVWTLGKAGFEVAKTFYPQLNEDGYKSEHVTHDLISMAFQLGPFAVSGATDNMRFCSEQQLRRYMAESLSAWVPKNSVRRPDGYSLFINPDDDSYTKVSYEVELHHKSSFYYQSYATFYNGREPVVDQVHWLVGKPSIANSIWFQIQQTMKNSKVKTEHYFISYNDFVTDGLRAKTICGSKENIPLCCALPNYQKFYKTSAQHDVTGTALTIAKTPHRSTGCKILSLTDFGNCMGVH